MFAPDLASSPFHRAFLATLQIIQALYRLTIRARIREELAGCTTTTCTPSCYERLFLCVINKHPNPRSCQLAVMEPHLPLVQLHDSTGKNIHLRIWGSWQLDGQSECEVFTHFRILLLSDTINQGQLKYSTTYSNLTIIEYNTRSPSGRIVHRPPFALYK